MAKKEEMYVKKTSFQLMLLGLQDKSFYNWQL